MYQYIIVEVVTVSEDKGWIYIITIVFVYFILCQTQIVLFL